jgi:hypothetical protein
VSRHRLCTCSATPQRRTIVSSPELNVQEVIYRHADGCLYIRAFRNPDAVAIASGLKGAFA